MNSFLRGNHVANTTGQRAIGRVLGQFYVDIEASPMRIFVAAKSDALFAPRTSDALGEAGDEQDSDDLNLS